MKSLSVGVVGLGLVTILSLGTQSNAAPGLTISSVTGTFGQDATMTISGAGFGSKPTAAPAVYDDFRSIPPGAQIISDGKWGQTQGWNVPVASTANLRPGTPFSQHMLSYWPANSGDNPPSALMGDTSNVWALFGAYSPYVYLDAWQYLTVSGTSPQNLKPFRLHVPEASPNAYINYYTTASGDSLAGGRDGSDIINPPANPAWSGWFGSAGGGGAEMPLSSSQVYGRWLHIQYLAYAGTTGNTDGSLMIYINGTLRVARLHNINMIGSGYAGWDRVVVGNYVRTDVHGPVSIYWDNVYVDTSWARVEIGDNATYGNCTHREIQVPTAWADGSITFTVNRGSFPNASGVYLFVVDASGNVSQGYALSGSQLPPAPTNVRIVG